MSTDYTIACFDCKSESPIFASASIAYGFKVWEDEDWRKWLGHREHVGHHEGHDLRIVSEHMDLPWNSEWEENGSVPKQSSLETKDE